MILEIIDHNFHYEMENLCRVFFPHDEIKVVRSHSDTADINFVITRRTDTAETITVYTDAVIDGKAYHAERSLGSATDDAEKESERQMAAALFEVLTQAVDYTPQWGILTGVRPSKLMINLERQYGEQGAHDYFTEKLLVSEEKTRLAMKVARAESKIILTSAPNSFSLYVGIPFCPTRCSYCSFVSHSIESAAAKKLIPIYVKRLCEELEVTGKVAAELNLKLESVYFGGGTPTSLSAEALNTICKAVSDNFDLYDVGEYTVEAGRPDTITGEKLEVLKAHGITRISINPQTFNNAVLEEIGRKHTAEQAIEAFSLARSLGFDNINMDLIAGLPGDSTDSFANSLDTAVELDPESITVHTLALKRSSGLVTHGEKIESGGRTAKMLGYASDKLTENEYHPYYMYRQSRSLGNLENIGWCKNGFECAYNVFMMEECHTVLACGAGSVTKLKAPHGDYIERIFNFKYPYEYNGRFNELLERKKLINEFYGTYTV